MSDTATITASDGNSYTNIAQVVATINSTPEANHPRTIDWGNDRVHISRNGSIVIGDVRDESAGTITDTIHEEPEET